MTFIKNTLVKMVLGNKYSNDTYIKHLKDIGVTIGERTVFHHPRSAKVDEQYPTLIKIGNNCHFANDFTIYTHDYSWCVGSNINGELFGACGKVEIGDNVFCGQDVTILRNVKIGSNCIIGSKSLVCKNIPDGEVWGGNPACFICKTEDFINKRREKQLEEAVILFKSYYEKYNEIPPSELFFEFFYLFENPCETENVRFKKQINCFNQEMVYMVYKNKKTYFKNYDAFCNYCVSKI